MNPGAESGVGSASGTDVEPVPGWTTANDFTVIQYAASSGAYPAVTDPGPPNRGKNLFSGGPDMTPSTATQTLQLQNNARNALVSGPVSYELCGWLGGYSSQDDNATLVVTFENGSGTSIGTATIGPVLAADRDSATGLLKRATTGAVPPATEFLKFTLTMTRLEGSYNDGYADNLDFSMTAANSGGTIPTFRR